jgi:hypothetical protein
MKAWKFKHPREYSAFILVVAESFKSAFEAFEAAYPGYDVELAERDQDVTDVLVAAKK